MYILFLEPLQKLEPADNEICCPACNQRHGEVARNLPVTQNACWSLLAGTSGFYENWKCLLEGFGRHSHLQGGHMWPRCDSEDLLNATSGHVWNVLCESSRCGFRTRGGSNPLVPNPQLKRTHCRLLCNKKFTKWFTKKIKPLNGSLLRTHNLKRS